MSNRPKLGKETKEAKAKREALAEGVAVMYDGKKYQVTMGDLSSLDIAKLRRETGYSWRGLMMAAQADPDIDVIACIVWLARRIAGEPLLGYEEIASEIGYDSDIDVVLPEDDDSEDVDPEA